MLELLLATPHSGGAVPPNTGYSMFGSGNAATSAIRNYTHMTDVVTDGTALTTASYGYAATSNGTVSLWAGYLGTSAAVDKFAFSNGAKTAGTALKRAILFAHGLNASLFGFFAGGGNSGVRTVEKYTYSGDVTVSAADLINVIYNSAGAGNSVFGLTGGGNNGSFTALTEKRTYANDSNLSGTSLRATFARSQLAAVTSSTIGIFGGGFNTTFSGNCTAATDRYTYAGDTLVGGNNLGLARRGLGGAGTGAIGLFASGYGASYTDYVDKYDIANGTRTAGTVLGLARQYLVGSSSNPGALS